MRKNYIAILAAIVLIAVVFPACSKGGSGETKVIGVLESWSAEDLTVVVNGNTYKLAEGMKNFENLAEAGKTYEFTLDIHGHIIKAKPLRP